MKKKSKEFLRRSKAAKKGWETRRRNQKKRKKKPPEPPKPKFVEYTIRFGPTGSRKKGNLINVELHMSGPVVDKDTVIETVRFWARTGELPNGWKATLINWQHSSGRQKELFADDDLEDAAQKMDAILNYANFDVES